MVGTVWKGTPAVGTGGVAQSGDGGTTFHLSSAAYVPLTLTAGGGHTMTTWRAQVPSMLTWMTSGLARAAQEQAAPPPRKTITLAANPG